jgi:DUF4097 and DUF4098 domain-containing protein YvlB
MTARRQRGAALLAGGLLALIFTAIAGFQIAGWSIGAIERTHRQVIPGPVSKLRVDAGGGDIVIVPSVDGRLHVDSTAKGALHTPRLEVDRTGTDVRLAGTCPTITFGPCSAEVRLQVPVGAAVEVESGSGDISADGLTAPVWLKTGSGDVTGRGLTAGGELMTQSGDVTLEDGRGNFVLDSASGDVAAGGLVSDRVRAETASGDVDLAFQRAPQDVDASTASGDVQVALPKGEAYSVEADSDSGDDVTEVNDDPESPRRVRARTRSGDVTVGYGN